MSEPRSLLDFIDTPVVVGDPDGRAVYANPAFQRHFAASRGDLRGHALAELFEGGGREAVLMAVARVCEGGAAVRFRIREHEEGYAALASPIEADQGRVGVVILLSEELAIADLGPALRREIQEPLEELAGRLAELAQSLGAGGQARHGALVDEAAHLVERLRKRCESWSAQPARRR